jgi:hypothetical protein
VVQGVWWWRISWNCVWWWCRVVDTYPSVESFCVSRRGTKKTQSEQDLKTPKS